MIMKFSSASSDVENLKKALDQLKRVQEELEETTEKLAVKEDQLRQNRIELAETVSKCKGTLSYSLANLLCVECDLDVTRLEKKKGGGNLNF